VFKAVCTILFAFTLFILSSYLLGSCRRDIGVAGLTPLAQEIPAGFPLPDTMRFVTKEGFELGRRLFYDGQLSIDGLHPCSSCHEQKAAFGTFEHDRSHGVNNSHTLRNAPVLFNLIWNKSFHWDGQFTSLESEAVQPIEGHVEMGETMTNVIRKLQKDPTYVSAFREIYHWPIIKPEFVVNALSQFTGYMVSANSRYDLNKKGLYTYTTQESNGYQIYKVKCATCHPEPLFTDYSFRNIGLPVDNFLNDYGRMRVTKLQSDSLKFKVPTLRNCYISSNYMHDGRFNTLFQVIEHYRTGVQPGANVDPLVANGISLTNGQVNDLYEWLKTLTDSSFLIDPRFKKPD